MPKPAKERPTPADVPRARQRTVASRDRLAHLIKHAIRALDRALQMRLAEHKVSIGHWVFLRALWAHDGMTQRQLSQDANVMEPTTYAAVTAMQALGYVERRQFAGNRRNVHVFLTARGRSLEATLVPLARQCNSIGVHGVAAADVAATRRTLLAIVANLARDEQESTNAKHRIQSTRERGLQLHNAKPAGPSTTIKNRSVR